MKKNYRKLILVLAIIALCVSAISISDVYAKYVASANGAVDISIARWDIKLNTLAIKNGTDISAELTPVFDTNANLAANKLAPGATGYFDLAAYQAYNQGTMVDYVPTDEDLEKGFATLPKVEY